MTCISIYCIVVNCCEVFMPCVHSTSKQFKQHIKRLVCDIIGNHKKEGD